MSASPPTTLGKYQIIREIARSNDIVYEAYDPLMNRRVAIKELSVPGGSTSQQRDERIRRFQREVKAAGSLAHPNIVTIYEVGEDGNRHFMAMEFLDGHNLRNELDTHGFLAPLRAVDIAIEVLNGLDFAHRHGVVHRDIKPDNIQLLDDGRVKLTDFGIARLTFEPNLTMDGQVFGTPSYMSPEQVVGKEIDARSDVFGLGVVLYEMIAGQKPFKGDNVIAITHAITNQHPDQPTQANHALWQVIQTAIDKTPAMRYPSAQAMREALESVLPTLQPGATVAQAAPPPVIDPYAGLAQQYPYANPVYTQPYVPAPQPQYAYNPYQGGQPGYQPTMGPGTLPPLPIAYYPPPPRRPMFSPATKSFFARFMLAFLVIGLFFALVVAAIIGLINVATKPPAQSSANPGAPAASGRPGPPPSPRAMRNPPLNSRSSRQPAPIPAEPEPALGPKFIYPSPEEARTMARTYAESADFENAAWAYLDAYRHSGSDQDAMLAVAAAVSLAEEDRTRRQTARQILHELRNAGYRDRVLDAAEMMLGTRDR